MTEKVNLMTEFAPISTEQWESVIEKDLKGADRTKRLVWKTIEGFDVEPYYRSEDISNIKHINSEPGQYPYVRGTRKSNEWLVRENIIVKNPEQANKTALEILYKGVTSLGFIVKGDEITANDLDALLKGIDLTAVEIVFNGCKVHKVADLFIDKLHKEKPNPNLVKVCFGIDPLSHASKKGTMCGTCFDTIAKLINKASEYKRLRLIRVSGRLFNSCGSNISEELAFTLAAAHEYIVQMMERGISIDKVAATIKFEMAISSDYFMEIAKFRAARMLWANVVHPYSPSRGCSEKMNVHAVTSSWNITTYDPYVNMLRGTTEAMSAAMSGVNSIEVLPFDNAYNESPSNFSLRIARNTQLLLKEEAHIDQVIDPSAGSYYIETLTLKIAEASWELFKQTESKGGYIASLKENFIQKKIEATAQKRDLSIATRREILLGTNQYPNFTEQADKSVTEATVTKSNSKCCTSSSCQTGDKESTQEFMPLTPYRGAMAFEEIRLKTDRSGKEPVVFMLTCGALSFARARAQFTCNFFACAGFKVIDNTYFKTIEQGVKEALNAKADIVVVCASDDDYATLVIETKKQLGTKAIIVVAGEPQCKSELEKAGVLHFISVKNNVLETLKQYQTELGI